VCYACAYMYADLLQDVTHTLKHTQTHTHTHTHTHTLTTRTHLYHKERIDSRRESPCSATERERERDLILVAGPKGGVTKR